MKPLTQKDLPILAEIIREAIHRKVVVTSSYLEIWKGNKELASIKIDERFGVAFSTNFIPGLNMKKRFMCDWMDRYALEIVI